MLWINLKWNDLLKFDFEPDLDIVHMSAFTSYRRMIVRVKRDFKNIQWYQQLSLFKQLSFEVIR